MHIVGNEKWAVIRMLIMDFDGVLTDGHVFVNQEGNEWVRCSRRDGLGIELLQKNGLEACVISKETNPVVRARCQKMGIACFQGVDDGGGKLEIMKRIMQEKGLSIEQVAYMGDDINDREPLEHAGLGITVADGHPAVKKVADYITTTRGGEDAVREVCEKILLAQGIPVRL